MIEEPTTRQHELERRVSALEDEVEGEKKVSRHILHETRRNSDDLATMKAQLSHLAGDMIRANAALNSHGVRLNVLTQDVREIRSEMGQMHTEVDHVHTAVGQMRTEVDHVRSEVGQIRTRLDVLVQDVAQVREDIAAIRAAVAPRESSV